ncbi:hypothetical protein Scep_007656 [Stephania cephalantha]|uniref:Uncharacterized protein n=1 Tax=Stephania cephalantha TaxID=152367 RepID=A0AAP0PNG8_9MAGN
MLSSSHDTLPKLITPFPPLLPFIISITFCTFASIALSIPLPNSLPKKTNLPKSRTLARRTSLC